MRPSPSGIVLPQSARTTHLHAIGQPGVGKSRGIESWFMQDVDAQRGAGVLDPHGELFEHLLTRLAIRAATQPNLAARVVLIDPTHPRWTVGFNPLEKIAGLAPERQAAYLSDVVVKVARLDSTGRTLRLLNHTFLALAVLELTLDKLPRFLVDMEWRGQQLRRTTHPELRQYFFNEFPQTRGGVHEWVTPVLNRLGALLFDPDLRLMFSTSSTIHFQEMLDRRLILLVNLSKGQLGEANSALLGAFLVAHIQKAALARRSGVSHPPFYLYLDEFQNYTTDNIKDILSESRKYALSLVLAHQYLEQLGPDLMGAVLNTTGTLVCFRVGHRDAVHLAHEIFPPDVLYKSYTELSFIRGGMLPLPWLTQHREPLTERELVTGLTQLGPREFWVKQRGAAVPYKQRTCDMPAPRLTEAVYRQREALEQISGERYGRLKSQLRTALKDEPPPHTAGTSYYEEVPPA